MEIHSFVKHKHAGHRHATTADEERENPDLVGVNAVEVFGAKNNYFLVINGDLGAAEFAVQNAVANLDGNGNQVAVLIELALADCQNDAALGLLLGSRSDVQTGSSGLFSFVALDDDAIAQRLEIHILVLSLATLSNGAS